MCVRTQCFMRWCVINYGRTVCKGLNSRGEEEGGVNDLLPPLNKNPGMVTTSHVSHGIPNIPIPNHIAQCTPYSAICGRKRT